MLFGCLSKVLWEGMRLKGNLEGCQDRLEERDLGASRYAKAKEKRQEEAIFVWKGSSIGAVFLYN